jgi:hypothetical protein
VVEVEEMELVEQLDLQEEMVLSPEVVEVVVVQEVTLLLALLITQLPLVELVGAHKSNFGFMDNEKIY